jgi:hypothetical protein
VFKAKNIPDCRGSGLQYPHSNSKSCSNSSVLDAYDPGSIPDRDMLEMILVKSLHIIRILFCKNIFSQYTLMLIDQYGKRIHKSTTTIMQYVGALKNLANKKKRKFSNGNF